MSPQPGYAHATYTILCIAFLLGWISSYILMKNNESDNTDFRVQISDSRLKIYNNLMNSMLEPIILLAIGAIVMVVLHAFVFPTIIGNDNEAVLFCGLNLVYPHFKLCLSHFLRKIIATMFIVVIWCVPILTYTVPMDKFVSCLLWSILIVVLVSFASS